jgi:hypothetical protein
VAMIIIRITMTPIILILEDGGLLSAD